MSYKPSNPNGQATMANSEPVVIASNQSAVPVNGSSSEFPLPAAQVATLTPPAAITGFATSAKQDTGNTSLGTIAGAVSGTEMQVDVLTMPTTAVTGTFWQATQPVSGTVTANL